MHFRDAQKAFEPTPFPKKNARAAKLDATVAELVAMSDTQLNDHIDKLSTAVGDAMQAYNTTLDAMAYALTERSIRRG